MRTIAILATKKLAIRPYGQWLKPLGCELILFTSDEAEGSINRNDYKDVLFFPDWKTNRFIDYMLLQMHRQHGIDSIVALSEADQLRAAQLRQRLGLHGQYPDSANAFRDKVVMKTYASSAGLAVPAFARVDTIWDITDFIATHPGPYVIKPIDGSGAKGVHILADAQAVEAWAAENTYHADENPKLIIEEFIDAPILAIDGLMDAGHLLCGSVSSYTVTCFDSLQCSHFGLLQFDPDDPIKTAALAYVKELLHALPSSQDTRSFHCELFAHPERGMIFCEIACRTGGSRLREMAQHALGIDLDQWSALGQAGFDPRETLSMTPTAKHLVGEAAFLNPGKTLIKVPTACPLPEVIDFTIKTKVGERAPTATKISEAAADVLFQAPNRSTLEHVYQQTIHWIEEEMIWE